MNRETKRIVCNIIKTIIFIGGLGSILCNTWWCLFLSTFDSFNLFWWWAISTIVVIIFIVGSGIVLDDIKE